MRGWLLPVGIGLALGLGAILVVLAVSGAESRSPADRSRALAAELRCPDCQGLSVADSPTRTAQEMRRQIDGLVAGGATDDEVRAHFTSRYGEWILLAPSGPVLWLLPFVVVLGGAVSLAVWLGRRPGRAAAAPGASSLSEEERRRLRDEVEALDA
jgi:cytochrome c-type biogenesis protein CcmH